MSWFSRRPAAPSTAAVESIRNDSEQLAKARMLRKESQIVGSAIQRAHEKNHIAAALEDAVMGRRRAS